MKDAITFSQAFHDLLNQLSVNEFPSGNGAWVSDLTIYFACGYNLNLLYFKYILLNKEQRLEYVKNDNKDTERRCYLLNFNIVRKLF